MDKCGYPTKSDLEAIRNWPYDAPLSLMEYVKERWKYADSEGWEEYDALDKVTDATFHEYELATAGWSGNEELVEALKENVMFWTLYWYSSRRDGHYEFRVESGSPPKPPVKQLTGTGSQQFECLGSQPLRPNSQILLPRIVQLLEEISAELRILNSHTKKGANPGIIV